MRPTNCGHFNLDENCKACQNIKGRWEKKLKGFKDIEKNNALFEGNVYGLEPSDDALWPVIPFQKIQDFLNHKDLKTILQTLFKHKNNKITPILMEKILTDHCEGLTLRALSVKYKITSNSTVFFGIRKVEEFIQFMNLEDDSIEVVIRDYNPETDSPLLFASWRHAIWYDQHTDNEVNPVFYRKQTKAIKRLLNDNQTKIKMAVLRLTPDQIVGYSVFNASNLEFIYVKLQYRKQGIAKLLAKGFNTVTKPMTKIGKSIATNKKLVIKENKSDSTEIRTEPGHTS